MAHTTHGHHIPGTPTNSGSEFNALHPANCGGVGKCPQCYDEVKKLRMVGEPTDYQDRAKALVTQFIDAHFSPHIPKPAYEVYVVWWSKTLQNWKGLLSTTMDDGMYYEVTHNGDNGETYFDAYKRFKNVVIKD